jgi:putative SOS response-associated peptidase YedK
LAFAGFEWQAAGTGEHPAEWAVKPAGAIALEEPLKIYPVSNLVNSPKTDDARCIEPVAIDRDFFERQWWGDEGKS